MTLLRFVAGLARHGFRSEIAVVGETRPVTGAQILREINAWFLPLDIPVHLVAPDGTGGDALPAVDATIATGWQTAYAVRAFTGTRRRLYFVQDYEPLFFPAGSERAFAEATYGFGFDHALTAGGWLATVMARDHGLSATPFVFSHDRNIYTPAAVRADRSSGPHRVFCYARPQTPRRGLELCLSALDMVNRALDGNLVVAFAGGDMGDVRLPFQYESHGVLGFHGLAEVFRGCDAALVLSLTNLSLLPLELMACGVPVVSNRGPHVEWLLDSQCAHLAEPTPEGLAGGLSEVLTDPERAESLRAAGFAKAAGQDWATEVDKVAEVLRRLP